MATLLARALTTCSYVGRVAANPLIIWGMEQYFWEDIELETYLSDWGMTGIACQGITQHPG